jgi:MFS family permease
MLAPAFGALSDRAGRLRPLRIALWGLTIVATLLAVSLPSFAITTAVLVVAGGIVTSLIYTPSVALVADRAEVAGLPHTLGFGAMNTAWAFGAMLGPAAGGAAAEALGDGVPMLAIAAAAVVSAVILTRPLQVAEPA